MATEEQVQQWIQEALNAEHEREKNAWIAAASIKLPQFWPDKAKLCCGKWLSQFDQNKISNKSCLIDVQFLTAWTIL